MANEFEARIVAENRALKVDYNHNPQTTVTKLVRRWPLVRDRRSEDVITYLQGPKSVTNPQMDGQVYEGLWRVVSAYTRSDQVPEEEQGYYQELAKGYAEVIDWTTARLISEETSPGNDVDVDTIPNTLSDDEYRLVRVLIPDLNPFKLTALILSLNQTDFNGLIVGGENLGDLHKVSAESRRAEDGSGEIVVTLAQPQYTLNAYADWGTAKAADRHYLWGVPKPYAQQILDDWKSGGDGRTAVASHTDGDLVDLVLTGTNILDAEIATCCIPITCDTCQSYLTLSGYGQNDLENYLDEYFCDPESPNYLPLPEGGSRTINITNRGDGLWDAQIVTRIFGPHEFPEVPDFSIELPTGAVSCRRLDHGWNYRKSEIDSTALQNQYNKTVAEVGRTVTFRVTREDDCSYDWVAETIIKGAFEETLTIGGTGVLSKNYVGRNVTGTEIDALEQGFVAGPRKRHQIRITPQDDDTMDVSVTETEFSPATTIKSGGGTGIALEVNSGQNVEATGIPVPTGNRRERETLNIDPNDDTSFNYRYTKRTLQATKEGTSGGGEGIALEVEAGANQDSGNLPVPTAGKRERENINISANDDGTVNYQYTKRTLQATKEGTSGGGTGIALEVEAGANQDSGTLPVPTGNRRERENITVSANDDGTVNYQYTKRTLQATKEGTSGGGEGIALEVEAGANQDSGGLPTPTGEPRQRENLTVSANDDGTVNYQYTKRTLQATSDVANGSGPGIGLYVIGASNQDVGTVPQPSSGKRERESVTISPNDDGTVNYQYTKRTLQATRESTSGGGEGIALRVEAGANQDSGGLPIPTGAPRERENLTVSANDDGTVNYQYTKRTLRDTADETNGSGDGIGLYVKSGSNQLVGTVPQPSSGRRERENVTISPNDDGTVNYQYTKRTLQATSDVANGSGDGIGLYVKGASNQDVGQVPTPTSGRRERENVTISPNDDGTVNYLYTKRTVKAARVIAQGSGQGVKLSVEAGANVDESAVPEPSSDYRQRQSMSVNPNDDDTFDYQLTTQEVAKGEFEASGSGDGIGLVVKAKSNADPGTIPDISAAPRDRESVSVNINDDSTINYVYTKRTVQNNSHRVDGTGEGIQLHVDAGANVDLGGVPIPSSGRRERESLSLSPNDDGTFNYQYTRQNVQQPKSERSSSGEGIQLTVKAGANDDEGGVPQLEGGKRVRESLSINPNDDDTFDYNYVKQTVQKTQTTKQGTGDGVTLRVKAGKNADEGDIPDPSGGRRDRETLSISPNDDETYDYQYTKRVVKKATTDKSSSGGTGISYTFKAGGNADEGDVPTPAGGQKIRESLSASANDDDTWNYSYTKQELAEANDTTECGDVSIEVGKNIANLPGNFGGSGDIVARSTSVSANDDGTFNWLVSHSPLHIDEHDLADTAPANKRHVQVGFNVDKPPSNPTGERLLSAFMQQGQNGKWNYSITSRELETFNSGTSQTGGSLFTDEREFAVNDDNAPDPGAGGQGETTTVSVSITEDGKFNWESLKRISSPANSPDASGKAVNAHVTISTTVTAYRNQTQIPAPSVANGQSVEFRNVRVNDDNTYDYTKVFSSITVNGGPFVVLSGKQIETNRDPVYARFINTFGPPYVYIITHIWKRYVYNQTTRSYTTTHPDLSNAGTNQKIQVVQILPNLFAVDRTTIIEGEWALMSQYKTIEPVPAADNTPRSLAIPGGGW